MNKGRIQVAVFQKAKNNYICNGDSYFYQETDDGFVCALADGLGSGRYAKESSEIVITVIRENKDAPIEQLIKKCSKQLVGKRGAVLGILKVNFQLQSFEYSSIGNIGMITVTKDNKKKRSIPNAGYLTGYQRPFKVTRGKLEKEMNFFMFSDGVTETDLLDIFLLEKDVDTILDMFSESILEPRKDDTTLIAIRYGDE